MARPLAVEATVMCVTFVLCKTRFAMVPPTPNAEVTEDLRRRLYEETRLDGEVSWKLRPGLPFIDLPAIARHFRAAYSGEGDLCEVNIEEGQCFHTRTLPLFNLLQQSAFSEVRGRVMLTIGTRLTAELAERVAEFAIAAEELPGDRKSCHAQDVFEASGGRICCIIMEGLNSDSANSDDDGAGSDE